MVLVQYHLALRGPGAFNRGSSLASLDLPVDATLASMADAVKAKHGVSDVYIHGPELEACLESGNPLFRYSRSTLHTCPDKFYVLCGGLYRRPENASDSTPLAASSKLGPLLEFNSLAAGSSTASLQGQPLQVHASTEPTARYTVKALARKSWCLEAAPSATVEEVKVLLQEQTGIPPDQQRLMTDKTMMEAGSTLQDYGLLDGAEITLVLRLRGGMYHQTSGRQDNQDLDDGSKERMMQVTVVVPGHGDVNLMVNMCKAVTGGELLNMALEAAAQQKGFKV